MTTILRCLKKITNALKKAEKRYKEHGSLKVQEFLKELSKIQPQKCLYLDESETLKKCFLNAFLDAQRNKKNHKNYGKTC